MNVDRRPIFTIGQVWFDFVKRLPRQAPRYRGKYDQTFNAFQQASAQQLAAMAAQQQQINPSIYQNSKFFNPYGQPFDRHTAGGLFDILGIH